MAAHPTAPREEDKRSYWGALRALRTGRYAEAAQAFEPLGTGRDLCGTLSRFYGADAHLRAGQQALNDRRLQEAGAHFRTALEFNPTSASLAEFLAGELEGRERRDRIQTSAAGAVQRGAGDARVGLAMALWREGHALAAVTTLRRGLHQDPDRVEWLYYLGLFLGAGEEYAPALAALRRAVDLDPAHALARVHLGLCLGALGQARPAAEELVVAQRLRPADARIGLLLTRACQACSAEAPNIVTGLGSAPDPAPVDLEDLEALSDLISREPEVIQAFVAWPVNGGGQDLFSILARALSEVLQRHPQRAELHYHLGRVLARLGRAHEAIASYEQALRLDGGLVPALIAVAKQYLASQRSGEAVASLERVLQMGCEYADVYYLLGGLYRERGDADRARSSYSRALDLNARYSAAREALENLAA